MLIEYYLGNLGLEKHSSEQVKLLRNIILENKPDPEIIAEFRQFVLSQIELHPDTASIINKALMTHYGSEYMGLGKDDFSLKAGLFKEFIDKFPNEFSFKFYYADACVMAEKPVAEIYPILKAGMLQDKKNINYPTAELFDLIYNSEYSFEFDMLLLDKYYQPCDKDRFDETVREFKEKYNNKEQQEYLERVQWKGKAPRYNK